MSVITQIKKELNQLGIEPKKSLGQNFLINEGGYRKIVAAAEIQKGDMVLEIGPGLGTLTEYLVAAGANVTAIEKDHKLAEYLKIKFAGVKNVTIVEEDILKFKPQNYNLTIANHKLIGNIPYYLTSHLLRVIFEQWLQPELIVLMLQKEVAQRITAKPPEMSLLAVSVQYYAKPKVISYVSKNSFYPAPKVDSAIVKLESRIQNLESRINSKSFFKVVRAGFAGKRKQLVNNFSTGLKIAKDEIESKLTTAGIDPRRRAETLTLEEWQKLANILSPSH